MTGTFKEVLHIDKTIYSGLLSQGLNIAWNGMEYFSNVWGRGIDGSNDKKTLTYQKKLPSYRHMKISLKQIGSFWSSLGHSLPFFLSNNPSRLLTQALEKSHAILYNTEALR